MFTRRLLSITGERYVPLQLGLATYLTLADSSSELTTGGSRCGKIHAEEYVVEDRRSTGWPRGILAEPLWERFNLT